jgi:hypothetical protein
MSLITLIEIKTLQFLIHIYSSSHHYANSILGNKVTVKLFPNFQNQFISCNDVSLNNSSKSAMAFSHVDIQPLAA